MNCKPYSEDIEIGNQWRFDREEIDQWMKAHAPVNASASDR